MRLESKWNTSSFGYAKRHMHRHGFGWRWWVENKAFFEHILISNIHGLALFFYDWSTESLFVCVMKHIEGHVPESALLCVHACVRTLTAMCACIYFICKYLAWVGAHILFGWLGFHWQDRGAVAGERDEGNLSALFSFISKIVVLGRQPLPIIAETGSDICLSCSWFSSVSAPENCEMRSVVEGSPTSDRPHILGSAYWSVWFSGIPL